MHGVKSQKYNPHLKHTPVKKAAGGIMLDGKHVGDTMRCVHCSAHWIAQPGSGRQRGYCLRCQGFLCGSPDCVDACLPLELNLQRMERNISKEQALKEYDAMPRTFLIGAKDLSHL